MLYALLAAFVTLLTASAFIGFMSRTHTPLNTSEPTTKTRMNSPMLLANEAVSMQAQVRYAKPTLLSTLGA